MEVTRRLLSDVTWALDNLLRPVVILVCGMLLFNLPTFVYRVRKMILEGIMYFLFCNDKSWRKTQDPAVIFGPVLSDESHKCERKTIYFVRHGESTWNDTFNKGHRPLLNFVLGFIPGLIKALIYEMYLILSGKLDSWFYDAPLSKLGMNQVEELKEFLKENKASSPDDAKLLKILRADPGAPPSMIVCSNLRRAASTLAAGFRDRLGRRLDEKVLVHPSLQEISRNPDTLSITPALTQIQASWIDKVSKVCDLQTIFTNQFDMSLHTGNKPIDTNGLKRMLEFCDFCFSSSAKEEHLIVGGHSIWFRSFFCTFLPHAVNHVSKKKKIVNCGVVAFDLLRTTTKYGPNYMVDPLSIRVVYGGF